MYKPREHHAADVAAELTDNTLMPTYSITGAPVAVEGSYLDFTVTRDGDTSSSAMVGFNTTTSGRASGGDINVQNWATFAAGSSTASLLVFANADGLFETTETFTLKLDSASDGGSIGVADTVTGTITDDGRAASVFSVASAGSVVEGSDLVYTVTRTGDISQAATVAYTVSGPAPEDQAGSAGSVSFAPRSATAEIRVATLANNQSESVKSLAVQLTDVTSGQGTISADPAEASATGIVADNGQFVSPVTPPVTPPVTNPSSSLVGTDAGDVLNGTSTTDLILGGLGRDTILGGEGDDNINGNQDADDVNGNQGNDLVRGGQGDDIVRGGKDNDQVYGDKENDFVAGDLGNDLVHGGQGNDEVRGGKGDDTVFGDLGDDRVFGDMGDDRISGGGGADTFVFATSSGNDILADYTFDEGDRLDFQGRAFTVSEAFGSSTITFADGGSVVLLGVTQAEFQADYGA